MKGRGKGSHRRIDVLFEKRNLGLALLLLAGCSSTPKQEAPPPPAPKPTVTAGKKAGSDDIVVKKDDRSKTEATYLQRTGAENISIDVKNADLAKVVLPTF